MRCSFYPPENYEAALRGFSGTGYLFPFSVSLSLPLCFPQIRFLAIASFLFQFQYLVVALDQMLFFFNLRGGLSLSPQLRGPNATASCTPPPPFPGGPDPDGRDTNHAGAGVAGHDRR